MFSRVGPRRTSSPIHRDASPLNSHHSLARPCPGWIPWLLLAAQLLLIEILDAANDVIRGDLIQPSPREAIANALRVIDFESVHGFFVEPDLYRFARHAHVLGGIRFPPAMIIDVANNVYAFFHICVPILVAMWVYVAHRDRFSLWRNIVIVAGIIALVGYFVFPVAPPRLTTGILVHGHAVRFHDTMPYPKNAILLNGRALGYNPYAAMPSLHIAWATIMSGTAILLTRSAVVRMLALVYPVLMTFAIIITANHYILDAIGGVITVLVALPLAIWATILLDRASFKS
jgi:hypothetical protein